jgi:hypothetical protein
MSVSAFKAGLRAHLTGNAGVSALVGSRVWPIAFPAGGTFPAVTYQVIDTATNFGQYPNVGLREITVDLLAVDDDSDTPDDVADAIEAALLTRIGDIGSSGVKVQDCVLAGSEARVDVYRPEERLYGVRLRLIFTI